MAKSKMSLVRESGLTLITKESEIRQLLERQLDVDGGILFFAPNWVPRSFCIPARRIKLNPKDYYRFGGIRGGIDERWFASTTPADNGPLTWEHEGLSVIVLDYGKAVLFKDAIDVVGDRILGKEIMQQYGKWMMYSKFFDNQGPLPHHVHQADRYVKWEGKLGKPEAYYYPPQVNNHGGDRPTTYFGLNPHVTKSELREVLAAFERGDNNILGLSKAHVLEVGTGWDVPAGILHAPGSLCTYEPQKASDVFAMYQSLIEGRQVVPKELLWKDCPPNKVGNLDYLIEVLDWEANVDPNFAANHFMRPKPARAAEEMNGFNELWVCYKSNDYSAKELTVFPGQTVNVADNAPYGFITMQGHGKLNGNLIDSPALINFGGLTRDEGFVKYETAKRGVKITNESTTTPLVMLKHFGPRNPDLKFNVRMN